MANSKISALTSATTPLAGTEVLPIVQSGATVKVANNDLRPKQIQSNATSGVLQIAGPAAASTRVMTTPDANFTAARTDAAQTFTGTQTFSSDRGVANNTVFTDSGASGHSWQVGAADLLGSFVFRDITASGAPTVLTLTGSTGDVKLNVGNLVQGTAAKGVNFTANTPATGMTSQLLNWYEEGTWTPTIIGTTTAGTGTYSAQLGRYTRIGRTVYIQLQLIWTAHTGTGNMKVAGLPFTSNASIPSQMSIAAYNMSLTALYFPIARQEVSTTQINLLQSPVGGGAWVGIPMDTNVDALEVSGSYTV